MNAILSFVAKVAAALVFLPIHLLASAFVRLINRRVPSVRVQIVYTSGVAFISSEYNPDLTESTGFIVSYMMFLSQYLYACDERQFGPVGKCIEEHIASGDSPNHLPATVLRAVIATFNKREQDALQGLFNYRNRPPISYIEGTTSESKMAKHSICVYRRGQAWSCDVRTSFWMNNILFPISAGILYNYVSDKLGAEEQSTLDSCIVQMFEQYRHTDCRSREEGVSMRVPNSVIRNTLQSASNTLNL